MKTPKATPAAIKAAKKLNVKLEDCKPTGKDGQIIVRDVQVASRPRVTPDNLKGKGKKYKPQRRDFTEGEVLQAISESKGYISVAAGKLGCTQQTIRNWMEKSEAVKEAMVDARCARGDRWELALERQIAQGIPASTIFGLKTQYKDRGYVERQELAHSGVETIGIEIVSPD